MALHPGPRWELHTPELMRELGCLLPRHQLHVRLIGPDVPPSWHGAGLSWPSPTAATCGTAPECSCQHAAAAVVHGSAATSSCPQPAGEVCISFWHGTRSDITQQQPADLVVALNAGLPAFPSWAPTLQALAARGTPPVVLTDYTEEAMERSVHLLRERCGARDARALGVNPFRCPAPSTVHGCALPARANAFAFAFNLALAP